jgi:RND family efflux transporter MFP subunit
MESPESQTSSPENSHKRSESPESQTSVLERSQPASSKPPSIKRLLPWFVLTLLLFAGGGFAWQFLRRNSSAPMAQQPQALPVKLETIESGTLEESSQFVGTLEAQQRVVLRPETSGLVARILVSSGDRVASGAPVVELRPERSRAEVNSAIADVNVASAARNNAQAQLKALEAERISAAAEVELQNEEFERFSFLVAEGAQAERELDRVKRDRKAALAALNAADEQVRAARASLDEANAVLSRAGANADVAREDLQDTRILAPIAGVIGDIPIKIGDYVDSGDTLTTITQNQTLELRLSIPVEREAQLRVGLPVELTTAQANDPIVRGQIGFISPQVDTNSQSILAKASFPNPDGRLRDEQYVQALVIWDRQPGVLIPTTAISRLGGQTFVFVAQQSENNQLVARQKPIQLGSIQGNRYQVLEGVAPGEQLITSGILNLSDGAPIMPES